MTNPLRLIRWGYVAPRLLLIVLVGLAVRLGLDPLLRFSLVRSGQAATGARVEVGDVLTSVWGTSARFGAVAIADPQSTDRNLFEIDEAWFDLDTSALLGKRILVDQGYIRGLRFGTVRSSTGDLDPEESETPEDSDSSPRLRQVANGARDAVGQWLAQVAGVIEGDIRGELISIALAEELAERWPREYARMDGQIRDIHARSRSLQQDYDSVRRDPAENLARIQRIGAETEKLRQDLSQVHAEIAKLGVQVKKDREAAVAAKAADEARIREHFQMGNLRPEAITEYLLREEIGGGVVDALSWLSWARRLFLGTSELEPERTRGWNVVFAGQTKHPRFLIRSLQLAGTGRWSGKC